MPHRPVIPFIPPGMAGGGQGGAGKEGQEKGGVGGKGGGPLQNISQANYGIYGRMQVSLARIVHRHL